MVSARSPSSNATAPDGRDAAAPTAKLQVQLPLAATDQPQTPHQPPPAAENATAGDDHAARAHLAILNACLRALAVGETTTSTTGS